MNSQPLPFPRERVVLEVLEDVEVDRELLTAVRGLADAGYRIALDDFVYRDTLRELVSATEIVKLDVLALDRIRIEWQVAQLRAFPAPAGGEGGDPRRLRLLQGPGF